MFFDLLKTKSQSTKNKKAPIKSGFGQMAKLKVGFIYDGLLRMFAFKQTINKKMRLKNFKPVLEVCC
jgi:hypothetical protein